MVEKYKTENERKPYQWPKWRPVNELEWILIADEFNLTDIETLFA